MLCVSACICVCVCVWLRIAIDNGKYSCLLARPEYHVNIYFNLREQAVLLAVVAFCAAFQSSTFRKPMEMQTLTNICTADSNGRKGVTA